MRISDWSSDVCSSDLNPAPQLLRRMRFEPYRVDARKLAHEGKDRDVTEPSRAASEIILVGEPRIELKEHVQTGGAMHQQNLAMARCIFITVEMIVESTVLVREQAYRKNGG